MTKTNNSRNRFGLTERDMKTIIGILSKYPEVREVRLFGSRAKGNYKTGSDIDFAVLNEGVSSKTLTDVSSDFEESSLPYMVDIVYFPTLTHKEFIGHIERVGVEFFKQGNVEQAIQVDNR